LAERCLWTWLKTTRIRPADKQAINPTLCACLLCWGCRVYHCLPFTQHSAWHPNKGLSSIEDIEQFTVKTVKVPATTIDAFVAKHKLKRVDFIKIDVEGAEAKVLKGSKKTIKEFKPIIEYEYSTIIDQLAHSQNTKECFSLLQQLGYVQYEIVNEKCFRLVRHPGSMPGSNILCFPGGKVPDIITQNERT
jgi:hypothetical protein